MTVTLAFETAGPGTGAPTLVFLGSLGADRSMWDPQFRALSRDFDVVAVDLRGHGESPAPARPYTVAALADDLLDVFNRLELPFAHLVGLSLGGAVAQWMAVHAPSRVHTLTLLCTAAKFGEPGLARPGCWRASRRNRVDSSRRGSALVHHRTG